MLRLGLGLGLEACGLVNTTGPNYLESVCRCNTNVGRYSIAELHFNDITNDQFFGSKVDLFATSNGDCILQ